MTRDESVQSLIERIDSVVSGLGHSYGEQGRWEVKTLSPLLSDCKTALLELTCEPSCEKHTPKKGMTSEEEAYRDSLNGQREPGHMGEPAT